MKKTFSKLKLVWKYFKGILLYFLQCAKILFNQLFCVFFSENVGFMNFFVKKCESKFPQFPHCAFGLTVCFVHPVYWPAFPSILSNQSKIFPSFGNYILILWKIEKIIQCVKNRILLFVAVLKVQCLQLLLLNSSAIQNFCEIKFGKFRAVN